MDSGAKGMGIKFCNDDSHDIWELRNPDEGEDKMVKGAKREGKTVSNVRNVRLFVT